MVKQIVKQIMEAFHLRNKQPVIEGFKETDPKWKWLGQLGINTILNIGSNEGQFASELRRHIPNAKIYCFEPLPEPFKKLETYFSNDFNYQGFPYALGKKDEVVTMYHNEYSPSSSMLKMNEVHKKHFDFAKQEVEITVVIKKLDDLQSQLDIISPLLVTLDVQGFEADVIEGGMETIKRADIIITEVSFTKLYEHQPLFNEIYSVLKRLGFVYAGNFDQLISPVSFEILQADAIFVKDGFAA